MLTSRLHRSAVVVLLTMGGALSAQDQATPTFDVASVKPRSPGDLTRAQPGGFLPGGRFMALNLSMRSVIASAYGVGDDRVLGGPGWLATDRFDISAQGDASASRPQMRLMVRALLADRFKLAVHSESRETGVYSLIRARSDGRLGPGLRPTSQECADLIAARRRGEALPPVAPPPAGAPVRGERARCSTIRIAINFMTATGVTLPDLASVFSELPRGVVDRVVQDQTGLMGPFDVDLHWSADRLGNSPAADVTGPAPVSDGEPSIFTALQEQLGLKLEATKTPMEVVVVDRIERPAPD